MARTADARVQALAGLSREFGPDAAREKLLLLGEVASQPPRRARDLGTLRSTLDFVRAYPDDAAVRRAAHDAVVALPAAEPRHTAYSWGTARRVAESMPSLLEIDWDDAEFGTGFGDTLDALVQPGESAGVTDPWISYREWFRRVRPARFPTDLAFFVDLLAKSGLPEPVQAHLFEVSKLPLVWTGPASCAVDVPGGDVVFQRTRIERERFDLELEIRRPPEVADGGAELVDAAIRALAARDLEIYPLLYAEPTDVRVLDGGRGLRVVFVGMRPEFRSPLETIGFFLVVKNGAPLGYGPLGALFGACEMGINLFPEFRGAEIRHVYAQVMRGLHHLYGIDRFWITRYGMGEGNPEAIDSGAFWFYRKLGFTPSNPEVETLARAEEMRRTADPSVRSDRRMLRRLSHTEAHFVLREADGSAPAMPFPQAALAMAESRFIAREFDGDRALARRTCSARVARSLGLSGADARGWGVGALSTTLAMVPDLESWTPGERAAVARFVVAKGASSERDAARMLRECGRLESVLRRVAVREAADAGKAAVSAKAESSSRSANAGQAGRSGRRDK